MTAVKIKGNCEYLMAYKQYNYSYDIQNVQKFWNHRKQVQINYKHCSSLLGVCE